MKIRVKHSATDTTEIDFEGKKRKIHANTVKMITDKGAYDLPAVAINTAEVNYHIKANIKPETALIQSVLRSFDKKELRNAGAIKEIKEQYRKLLTQHPDQIVDFCYQIPQKLNLTKHEIQVLEQIQVDAGAMIISTYETDRNQSAQDFENEMLDAQARYKDHTVSPTIDIGIEEEGLFTEKVKRVLRNGFTRFNVIFRSIPDNYPNWLDLSELILNRNVWVNVVGISQRWYNTKLKISQMSRVFLFGVHSASQGYPWMGTPKAPSYVLNDATLCFNEDKSLSYEQSRAVSADRKSVV